MGRMMVVDVSVLCSPHVDVCAKFPFVVFAQISVTSIPYSL